MFSFQRKATDCTNTRRFLWYCKQNNVDSVNSRLSTLNGCCFGAMAWANSDIDLGDCVLSRDATLFEPDMQDGNLNSLSALSIFCMNFIGASTDCALRQWRNIQLDYSGITVRSPFIILVHRSFAGRSTEIGLSSYRGSVFDLPTILLGLLLKQRVLYWNQRIAFGLLLDE